MKLVKMSLVAAMVMGASAFAIDNVKVDGDAKLYYITNNAGANNMFSKNGTASSADTAVRLGVTGDLMKGVSFGVTGYAVSTLGLENNLVSNTFTGGRNGVADNAWLGEAWLATTMGKTTAKVGRMALDTPLAFSETWSVVPNTFEAAVLINQDIPDTTLVGAWVGKGNGYNVGQGANLGNGAFGYVNSTAGIGIDGIMGKSAAFGTFGDKGAYAVAAVNNSLKFLTAQAWYYNVVNIADAYWLQADWDCLLIKNAKVGVQYADISPKGALNGVKDSSAYAAKVGYEGVKNLKVSAAYSKADQDGAVKIANVATNNLNAAQSKLYTEAFWNYGYVGNPDARTYMVAGEYNAGIANVGAQYTDVSIGTSNTTSITAVGGKAADTKMKEAAVYASKDFGPLNATLAYFSTKATDQDANKRYDSVLAMFKVKF